MPIEAQTRLLRVLQEGEYTAVGGRTSIRTDVRIVAATHRDLRQMIRQGLFREDLFYRLNVVPIRLPPLRERTEDVPALIRHFLAQVAKQGLPLKTIDQQAMDRLKSYRWPGNVRELENWSAARPRSTPRRSSASTSSSRSWPRWPRPAPWRRRRRRARGWERRPSGT